MVAVGAALGLWQLAQLKPLIGDQLKVGPPLATKPPDILPFSATDCPSQIITSVPAFTLVGAVQQGTSMVKSLQVAPP